MKSLLLLGLPLVLVACATDTRQAAPVLSLEEARAKVPQTSPECLAQNPRPGEPFPASAIPAEAMAKKLSGLVAMRYDVIAGAAQNIEVVASTPPGVYDAAALQHAARYREPRGITVRGCIMTIEVKF